MAFLGACLIMSLTGKHKHLHINTFKKKKKAI